jgi:hypothetical protein
MINPGVYGKSIGSNFDYRSNLYNNEPGFFFPGAGVRQQHSIPEVDILPLGAPEWLERSWKVTAARLSRHVSNAESSRRLAGLAWST